MKAKAVKYKTTITGIQSVELSGKVVYDADLECYVVGGDSVEYWLERIADDQEGAWVTVEIKVMDGKEDDSKIIEERRPLMAEPIGTS